MHIFCCRIPCCFHVLLTNNAAVSTGGRGPVAFRCFCFSSDIYTGVDLLDHSSRFGFLRNLHIVFQSSCGHLPSHEQGSYSPCCLRGCTHSAREAPGRPPALRPAQGAGCVWPRPGLPSTPAELLAPREASPPVWSPFLRVPPGHQAAASPPFMLVLCGSFTASAVSLSARFQLLLSEICSDADVCMFMGRGEFWLEVSYYAIHPETILINKIFFFLSLWRKISIFLGSWVFLINLGRPKLSFFADTADYFQRTDLVLIFSLLCAGNSWHTTWTGVLNTFE